MKRLHRILCATEFSEPWRPAWEFAQRLARATDATLLLLHVVPISWIPVPIEVPFVDPEISRRLVKDSCRAALERLDQLAHEAQDLGVRVRVEIKWRPPR